MLKINLQPQKQTLYQFRSINHIKTLGHHVYLQEGSNYSYPQLLHLKSGDFIGAYLQAKVIGRHFVRLPLEYTYYFPEYAKYFGTPSLLKKGIYGLVYSGKYWNIDFSEWLHSKGFIQSQAELSCFVFYNKHNQWLRLLFFVNNMLYVGCNDAIKKEFKDSVSNRFDVKFLGPAKWFLQMRIHQHKDKSYTLDQHCYVLNTLQCYDPNSEFPEHETPFPPDYTFTKYIYKTSL